MHMTKRHALLTGIDLTTPDQNMRLESCSVDTIGRMTEATQILAAIERGDLHSTETLFPLVYDELRRLAAGQLAHESPGGTLQATALVHEAYVRLVDVEQAQHWNSRGHFFAAAAEAMRRILVDSARRRQSLKRGGDRVRHELNEFNIAAPESSEELLALDEALNQLAENDKLAAELVKLRYFAGLTMQQAAESLGIPLRTAERLWTYGRTWLYRAIHGD
jgi:RNA polymerase sigma factor (TIGR02999 family)